VLYVPRPPSHAANVAAVSYATFRSDATPSVIGVWATSTERDFRLFCYDEVVWHRQAIRHGGKFLKHMVPAVVKPMHSLWNEVIGFFFLCFAAVFGFRMLSYYRSYVQAPPAAAFSELMRVVVTAFFVVVMAVFGISSFLRARKISRS
jgi:hypothetical protein